jgi:hypothetical protein
MLKNKQKSGLMIITNKELWNWSSELIQDLFLDVLNGNITIQEAKEIITRKDKQ